MADPSSGPRFSPPPDLLDPQDPLVDKGEGGGGGLSVIASGEQINSPSPNSSMSTPPWIVWTKGLNALLDDPQGQELFKAYLNEEGCYKQLTFLWACEGLKRTNEDANDDPTKIPSLVKKIYNVFILNLLGLSDSTKSDLAQAIDEERFTDIEIFSKAKEEVLTHMKENLYPNFLKSEFYLEACNGEDAVASSSASGSGDRERRQSDGDDSNASVGDEEHSPLLASRDVPQPIGEETYSSKIPIPPEKTFEGTPSQAVLPNQLPTVHEDKELSTITASQLAKAKKHYGLTKEALLATEFQRASEFPPGKSRKNEIGLSRYFMKATTSSVPFPYHASYSSYNPVSRVDSEIQSMSSDAMTDDGTGGSHRGRHHGHSIECRRYEDRPTHRSGNSRSNDPHSVRQQHHSQSHHGTESSRKVFVPGNAPLNPNDDLRQLPTEGQIFNKPRPCGPDAEKDPAGFVKVISEKLEAWKANQKKDVLAKAISKLQTQDEESPMDIIDMHFERVSYFADATPKSKSPKLKSPVISRRKGPFPPAPVWFPLPHTSTSNTSSTSRNRDFVQSTFSVDSGNVSLKNPDSESLKTHYDLSGITVPKSRSVPHELRAPQDRRQPAMPQPRSYHNQSRGFPGKVSLGGIFNKKSSMEFIDSGISVVSDQSTMPLPSTYSSIAAASGETPIPTKKVREWMESQSRSEGTLALDFLHQEPHSGSQTHRRAFAERLNFHVPGFQSKDTHSSPQSSTSVPIVNPTLSEESSSTSIAKSVDCIPTVVRYDDDKDKVVPYVLKIPRLVGNKGSGVTLAALKERLPHHGVFRYFFRTKCPDLDSPFVHEEISEDTQELPMLNGKIYAHLKTSTSGLAFSHMS